MANTGKGYPYPQGSDGPDGADVPFWIKALADFLQANGAMYASGTIGSRPSAGIAGRFFRSTNETPNQVYLDTGSAWLNVSAMGDDSVMTDMIQDGAVTEPKLATDAVGPTKIQANAVTGTAIADGAVGTAAIADELKPSAGAAGATEALRALGTGAGQALGIAQVAQIILTGLLAAQPAANSVPAGTIFFATDTLGTWRSDHTAWTLIAQRAARITPATFRAAPFSTVPYDGQMVAIVVDTTTEWTCRYSSATSVWLPVGDQAPLGAYIAGTDGNGSALNAVFFDTSGTAGPSITVPLDGDYEISVGALAYGAGTNIVHIAPKIGAAATDVNDAAMGAPGAAPSASHPMSLARRLPMKTLTRTTVLKLQYEAVLNASSTTFLQRSVALRPIRVATT